MAELFDTATTRSAPTVENGGDHPSHFGGPCVGGCTLQRDGRITVEGTNGNGDQVSGSTVLLVTGAAVVAGAFLFGYGSEAGRKRAR